MPKNANISRVKLFCRLFDDAQHAYAIIAIDDTHVFGDEMVMLESRVV